MENIKKVALISTYCDTQEKIDVLIKNIDKVKAYGLDVIVISPIFLPQYVQTKCDYFLLTKDNPVLDWPGKAMQAWKNILINSKSITVTRVYADYGWAGLFQVKKLSELALTLDYDYFYHMIYAYAFVFAFVFLTLIAMLNFYLYVFEILNMNIYFFLPLRNVPNI